MFKNNKFGVSDAMIEAAKAIIEKKLIGNQHKIDANHNGKIDAQDFKILKGKKKTNEEVELGEDTFTKQYRNNEDDNKHSENVVLLAKHFGSKTDHEKAKDILQQHMKIGHMPDNLRDEREKIHKKLWPKARAHMMHQEEVEAIDELDKNTLGSYIKSASTDMRNTALQHGSIKKMQKRSKGIEMAADKLAKEEVEFSANELAHIEAIVQDMK